MRIGLVLGTEILKLKCNKFLVCENKLFQKISGVK